MKFLTKDFYSKCKQKHRKLQIWSKVLNKFFKKKKILCSDFDLSNQIA